MTSEFLTSGFIEAGQMRVRNREALEDWAKRQKDCELHVTIQKAHATRSQLQNRYWWAVCVDLVSEHTGYTPDEVHELAKQMFLPKKLAVCDGNGEVKGEFVIGGTTTTLNKLEFGEFIEHFRRWAAMDLGVVIPDPDIDWREHEQAS